MKKRQENAPDLTDPRPEFLRRLDSDRGAALTDFKRFVDRLFREAPPSNFFRVPVDEQDDVMSELILHCIDNDCAKLRMFQPREGSTFAGWLAVVASRKVSDFIKRKKSVTAPAPPEGRDDTESPVPGPEQIAIQNEIEGIFLSTLRKLSKRCQLLLRLRLLEYKNREIVQLLRLAKSENKTIGNQIIQCRRKLIELLRGSDYFEGTRRESG